MLIFLDSQHYKDFNDLYGTETKEYLPSLSNSLKETIPARIINNNRIRDFIFCAYCNKPRCIFSKNVLNDDEKLQLRILIEDIVYHCGSPIVCENHPLFDTIYIRQKINCKTPVEAVYYSCKRLNTEIICYYCGEKEGLLEPSENLLKNYQTVYPFCEVCKKKGYNWPTRGKIKVGQKRKRVE